MFDDRTQAAIAKSLLISSTLLFTASVLLGNPQLAVAPAAGIAGSLLLVIRRERTDGEIANDRALIVSLIASAALILAVGAMGPRAELTAGVAAALLLVWTVRLYALWRHR